MRVYIQLLGITKGNSPETELLVWSSMMDGVSFKAWLLLDNTIKIYTPLSAAEGGAETQDL